MWYNNLVYVLHNEMAFKNRNFSKSETHCCIGLQRLLITRNYFFEGLKIIFFKKIKHQKKTLTRLLYSITKLLSTIT